MGNLRYWELTMKIRLMTLIIAILVIFAGIAAAQEVDFTPSYTKSLMSDELISFDKIIFIKRQTYHSSSLSQIKYRDRGLFADISKNDISDKETANEKVYS